MIKINQLASKTASTVLVTVLLSTMGCASTSYQTSTAPISAELANQVVDGADTRTDIIAMFGPPNGFEVSGYGLQAQAPKEAPNDLLSYKDCVVKSAAQVDGAKTAKGIGAAAAVTVLTGGIGIIAAPWLAGGSTKNTTIEECKMFAAIVDENDVVKSHGFVNSNIFNEEQVKQVTEGSSTKADVIRVMSAPKSVNNSGSDEIYTYKNCFQSGGSQSNYSLYSSKTETYCQQSSFIIDSVTSTVKRVTFIPFPEK